MKILHPDFSKGPLVMGIVNVTPDSFSDGGRYEGFEKALEHALRLEDEGADILDIGGESSRPFAEPVSEKEELKRVIPLISALVEKVSVPISIDTVKSGVARLAVEAGASVINDISAMTIDPDMLGVAARSGAYAVLMHMKGEPRTMQIDPFYEDVVSEIKDYLGAAVSRAENAGIDRKRIIVDPGIGFGKSVQHNISIIKAIPDFKSLGVPVLIGPSRKSFIQKILGTDLKSGFDRIEAGTLAVVSASAMKGADIIRVHNVKAARAAMDMIKTLS